MKKIRKKILLIGCVMFLHGLNVAAGEWFVRPAGGNYGSEDGSSYQDAWDGLPNVTWGSGGVQPGDTLYVCGLHLHDYTGWRPKREIYLISGTSESQRITIRGDYPGDKGVIWGAGRLSYEEWVNEGNGVWSITSSNFFGDWFFEDVTKETWTVLDKASSLAECNATPGSHYSEDYRYGSKLYIHTSDGNDPTGRIVGNRLGYDFKMNGTEYITFRDLEFYSIANMWIKTTSKEYASHIRWENCKVWYGELLLIEAGPYSHHIEIENCDLAWSKYGIGIGAAGDDGVDASTHDVTIRNNYIHDIGNRESLYNTDSHAISSNSAYNVLVENNTVFNAGAAIQFYAGGSWQQLTNITIRWNLIKDCHTLGGTSGYALALMMSGQNIGDKSSKVYGNIVTNSPIGYRTTWPADCKVDFYNNVAYDCGTSFYFNHTYQDTGPNIKLRNNISVNPKTLHLYFGSNANEGNYTIDSDYNLFYPDMTDGFVLKWIGSRQVQTNFSGWQALSRSGCTFDPHSIATVPLFVDVDNGDFRLQAGSPAIDAGIDVGLTQDFAGNPVPQGTAPDIGAYEYGSVPDPDPDPQPDPDPDPPKEPEDIPTKTELKCYNNVFNPTKGEEAIISVELDKQAQVSIIIYDNKGKEIKNIMDEEKQSGFYSINWNGNNESGNIVGSGIYIVHMKSGKYNATKKIAIVK